MKERKRIVLLGGKDRFQPVVRKAKSMGLETLVLDKSPTAPAFRESDQYAVVDISNHSLVLEAARRFRADAILSLSEFGVLSAAQAASALELPGNSIQVAINSTNKIAQRKIGDQFGIRQPRYCLIDSYEQAVEAINVLGYPAVIKPPSSAAARGISVIRESKEIEPAWRYAQIVSNNAQILCEEYVPGREFSCEVFSDGKNIRVLAVGERTLYSIPSHPVAQQILYPALLDDQSTKALYLAIEKITYAMNINGPSHTEMILAPDGHFYWLESAARGGGGNIWTQIVQSVSGVDYLELSIRFTLGQVVSVPDQNPIQRGACYLFLDPPRGKLVSVHGADAASKVPGIIDIGITVNIGDEIKAPLTGADRVGWIVSTGKDRTEALQRAIEAEALLIFEVT